MKLKLELELELKFKMSVRRYTTLINKILNLKKYDNTDKFDSVCTRIYILKLNKDDDELIIESLDKEIYLKNLELVKVEKDLITKQNNVCKNNIYNIHNIHNSNGSCCPFRCCKFLNN